MTCVRFLIYLLRYMEVDERPPSEGSGSDDEEQQRQEAPRSGFRSPVESLKHKVPMESVQNHRVPYSQHLLEQALRQRLLSGGNAALLPHESDSVSFLATSMMLGSGFTRAAQVMEGASTIRPRNDLSILTLLHAHHAVHVYDDESAWDATSLANKEVPLVQLDERSGAEGGTVRALIQRLIAAESDPPLLEGKPKIHFTNVFLFTSHLFVSPDFLFANISRILMTCAAQSGLALSEPRAIHLQRRCIAVLGAWVKLSHGMIPRLLLKRMVALTSSFSMRFDSPVAKEMTALHRIIGESSKRTPTRAVRAPNSAPIPPPRMDATSQVASILDLDDLEFARQLSLLTFEIFRSIRLRELEHASWNDPILRQAATGVHAFVGFLDHLSRWLVQCIVSSPDSQVQRLCYRKVVRVARHLYDLQNYAALDAAYQCLDHNSVTALSAAKEPLPNDEEDSLEAIRVAMNPFSMALSDLPHAIGSPAIPLPRSVFMVLSRVEENYRTFIQQRGVRLVNWSKMVEVGVSLIRFASFQALPYNFVLLPNVQNFIWRSSQAGDL